MARRWLVGWGLLLFGCSADPLLGEDAASTSETGPPSFEPPEPACGDGYVDPGEQCDDANLVDGDGCDSLCQVPCGLVWETTSPSPAVDMLPSVVDVAVGPSGEIVLAGLLTAQTSELDDAVWLGAWSSEGEPIWSGVYDLVEGRDDAPAGVAIGPDGAVYISATVAAADGTDIWVGRLDGSGAEVWSVTFDAPLAGSKDAASGIAVAPSGNPVVAGHQRVGDKDSDLWVAELTADAGVELWSTTWSAAIAENGYSLDDGGPIAIADDGTIWATAIAYVAFDRFDVHVLGFDPSGALLGDWAPQVDATPHRHVPAGIAAGSDGSVVFTIARLGPGATFWLHRLDPAVGELAWVREMPSFVDAVDAAEPDGDSGAEAGEAWVAGDLAAAPDASSPNQFDLFNVFIGGTLLRKELDDSWTEGWLQRLDPAGATLCTTQHAGVGATLLTPNLMVTAIAASPDSGDLVAAGWLSDVENSHSLWVGAFRGP